MLDFFKPKIRKNINVKVGDKFWFLTIKSFFYKMNGRFKQRYAEFICDCGNETSVIIYNVMIGRTKSCGCNKYKEISKKLIDRNNEKTKIYIGKKFNNLTIIDIFPNGKSKGAKVKCDCGKIVKTRLQRVILGYNKSCGCSVKVDAKIQTVNQVINSIKIFNKKRNLSSNLKYEDIDKLIFQNCKYCGNKPSKFYSTSKNKYTKKYLDERLERNGIDRINSSKGYIKGNVVTCCYMCNKMKMNLGLKAFVKHIKQIHSHLQSKLKSFDEI